MSKRIAYRNKPGATQILVSENAIQRTRLRLLDIYVQVIAFRWRKGKLPETLKEIGKSVGRDPLTGAQFQYSVLADGSFDVLSLGTPTSGPIKLAPKLSVGNGGTLVSP